MPLGILSRAQWVSLGDSWGPLGSLLGTSGALLGTSWEPLGRPWGALGSPNDPKRLPRGSQEAPKRLQEPPKSAQETPKRRPRGAQEASRTPLGIPLGVIFRLKRRYQVVRVCLHCFQTFFVVFYLICCRFLVMFFTSSPSRSTSSREAATSIKPHKNHVFYESKCRSELARAEQKSWKKTSRNRSRSTCGAAPNGSRFSLFLLTIFD